MKTLDEFQNEVGAWGDATFPNSTWATVASHFEEEAAEFMDALRGGRQEKIEGELADSFLLLMQFAHKTGVSLYEAAERKMIVNRARTWKVNDPEPGGHVKHVVDTKTVYLAAAYNAQELMRFYAVGLSEMGYEVTSRWILGQHDTPPDGIEPGSIAHHAWAANDDLADIDRAATVILFTAWPSTKGGRHVEFGYALATGKKIVVIGERESVFHSLPQVAWFPAWADYVQSLGEEVQPGDDA